MILLRADIDALEVTEETGVDYASENPGFMHACGHDAHIAMLLTAAKILMDHRDELHGTVRLAFQPGEESGTGADAMIQDGVLDGVEKVYGQHIWAEIDAGKFACIDGPMMAACDKFIIDVRGRGGHGAMPHKCVDAVTCTAAIINNLQMLVSRESDPMVPVVLTVGMIGGGTRWNVVAERAHLEGTTRYLAPEMQQKFPEMMRRVVEETARTFRCEADLNYIILDPLINNDPALAAIARAAADEILGEGAAFDFQKTMTSEDFGFFMQKIPCAYGLVGMRDEASGAVHGHHSGKFTVNEAAMIKGAMIYADVAMRFCAS